MIIRISWIITIYFSSSKIPRDLIDQPSCSSNGWEKIMSILPSGFKLMGSKKSLDITWGGQKWLTWATDIWKQKKTHFQSPSPPVLQLPPFFDLVDSTQVRLVSRHLSFLNHLKSVKKCITSTIFSWWEDVKIGTSSSCPPVSALASHDLQANSGRPIRHPQDQRTSMICPSMSSCERIRSPACDTTDDSTGPLGCLFPSCGMDIDWCRHT